MYESGPMGRLHDTPMENLLLQYEPFMHSYLPLSSQIHALKLFH